MASCNEDLYNMTTITDNLNKRMALYKKPVKKDNYKFEYEFDETPQEVRRRQLLTSQKKNRNAILNSLRGITSDISNVENVEEEENEMEVDKVPIRKKQMKYANRLMMSEWMLEVPQDFLEKWIIVPCPIGKRTLLVANRGSTTSYSRRGKVLATFHSALPGGNSNSCLSSCTILDCIWVPKEETYYALDVLAWSNQPMLDCDAEFRFFWLKTQLADIKEVEEHATKANSFPIISVPSTRCNSDLHTFTSSLSSRLPLDGFLFYHSEALYMNGSTPLVTWLKPHMLPEVLGINVPSPFDEKPDGYIDFNHCMHHILKKKSKQKREESMEVEPVP